MCLEYTNVEYKNREKTIAKTLFWGENICDICIGIVNITKD